MGSLWIDHHERHTGIVKGDGQVEVINACCFHANDDVGQAGQFLHQTGPISRGVGELLCFVRGAVLADDEDQLLRANINTGEERSGFLGNYFGLNGHDVYL